MRAIQTMRERLGTTQTGGETQQSSIDLVLPLHKKYAHAPPFTDRPREAASARQVETMHTHADWATHAAGRCPH